MLRRVAGVCGIASQAIGLVSLLIAVSMSPWFSWTENHLSVLGSMVPRQHYSMLDSF